jgi:hypothetical protein
MVEKVSFSEKVKDLEMIFIEKRQVLSGIQLYYTIFDNFFMVLDQFHKNCIYILIGFE